MIDEPRRWLSLLAVAFALVPLRAPAQVVTTPEGQVEFIGLKRWTVQMVRDTMAKRAPGQPLGQCAGVLQSIGFASASSLHELQPDGTEYVVVTVVEPEDRDRVHLRPPPPDSLPDVRSWRPMTRLFRERNRAFQLSLAGYLFHRAGDTAAIRRFLSAARADSLPVIAAWHFLDRQRSHADLHRALRILHSDRNRANAATAAAILLNFAGRDTAWWALADALRDGQAPVAATASQVLAAMSSTTARRVDWRPALPALRDLLGGTNVFLLYDQLDILLRTGIAPELAPELLADGHADLIVAALTARHTATREVAHRFLSHLAGRDLGCDARAWTQWIATLR
jgi:hypothetical protein